MRALHPITPAQLPETLLRVALARPIHLWGAPGIGKSTMVERFAAQLGMDCVTMLATQLAPEDIAGVPQLVTRDGVTFSRFAPPELLVRREPFVLFLDELNGARPEVQKSLYPLVLTGQVGDYELPKGSVVIAAGNRATDQAAVKPMPAPLINRFVHIHLRSSVDDWLVWATQAAINSLVVEYIGLRPDHLHVEPPKTEEAFSTPRSWHALADALTSWGTADRSVETVTMLAHGCVSPAHAASFAAWYKTRERAYDLDAIIKGELRWPTDAADRDLLHFHAMSLRARLVKDLPADRTQAPPRVREFALRGKSLLVELSEISLEIAQLVAAPDDDGAPVLPAWFLTELVRDVPRLAERRGTP